MIGAFEKTRNDESDQRKQKKSDGGEKRWKGPFGNPQNQPPTTNPRKNKNQKRRKNDNCVKRPSAK